MAIAKRSEFLTYSTPAISEDEIKAVVETLRSGWLTTGPRTRQFEEEFCEMLGAEKALALSSCTAGLHLALVALGIGEGDEVISTPNTFCASINVIEHVGARPVLVDVEADTMNIDPVHIAEAITPKTKAILPVHLGGHPADMAPIMELAHQHNLYVIEDAAHSVLASYRAQSIGTIGDLTAFSFYVTKNLTTIEGGMLTGSEELIDRARVLSLHGMDRNAWKRYSAEGSWYYDVVEAGYKYNMTDVQAAIGLVQMKRLAEMQARRREIVERYHTAFSQYAELQIPVERDDVEHAWHLYILRLYLERLNIDRAQFIEELKVRNIGTSVHFVPIHLHPYYRDKYGWKPEDFSVAYNEYRRVISLPLHPLLTDQDVDDVINAVIDVVEHYRA